MFGKNLVKVILFYICKIQEVSGMNHQKIDLRMTRCKNSKHLHLSNGFPSQSYYNLMTISLHAIVRIQMLPLATKLVLLSVFILHSSSDWFGSILSLLELSLHRIYTSISFPTHYLKSKGTVLDFKTESKFFYYLSQSLLI